MDYWKALSDAFSTLPEKIGVERVKAARCQAIAKALEELAGAVHAFGAAGFLSDDRFNVLITNLNGKLAPEKKAYEDGRSTNLDPHYLDEIDVLLDRINDLRAAHQRYGNDALRDAQPIADLLTAIGRNVIKHSTGRRRASLVLLSLPIASIVGLPAYHYLYKPYERMKKREEIRKTIAIESIALIDAPYTKDTSGSNVLPSENKNVVDRRFRWTDFSNAAVATALPEGELLESLEQAKSKVEGALGRGPLLLVTGRIGFGLGYVWAHLFARILQDSMAANGSSPRIAGVERWVFALDQAELLIEPPIVDKGSLGKYLLRKANERVTEETLTEADVLQNCVILVVGSPSEHLERYLDAFTLAAYDWNACLVVSFTLDALERLQSHQFRRGYKLELLEYSSDEVTSLEVIRAALRQRLKKIKNEAWTSSDVEKAARLILANPLARAMTTYNWRISPYFIEQVIKGRNDTLHSFDALSTAQTEEIAKTSLRKAIDDYSTRWVVPMLSGSNPRNAVNSGEIVKLINGALIGHGSGSDFTDDDFRGLLEISRLLQPRYGETPLRSQDADVLLMAIKGSPFFKSDSGGRMTWQPFVQDASRFVQ